MTPRDATLPLADPAGMRRSSLFKPGISLGNAPFSGHGRQALPSSQARVSPDFQISEALRTAGSKSVPFGTVVKLLVRGASKDCNAPLPDTLDVDDDGQPADDRLQEIHDGDASGTGARQMIEMFPALAGSLRPYVSCTVTDNTDMTRRPIKRIGFSTSGWSGCEDFVNAVLGNMLLRALYYAAGRRGGHHVLEVPVPSV